jgi:hypothetical protein
MKCLLKNIFLGVASIASSLSQNIDALVDFKIKAAFKKYMPMNVSYISSYPDWLAFGIVLFTSSKN